MTQPDTVVLNRGGVRSFVASAIVVREYGGRRTLALCMRQGDSRDDQVLQKVRKQAEYLEMSHVVTVDHVRFETTRHTMSEQTPNPPILTRPRLILTAISETIELGAKRLVWPIQVNGSLDLAAKITEQTTLLGHMVDIEHPTPIIESPLIELNDLQVLELGNRMGLPWELTWSCMMDSDEPCRACDGCKRRRSAFEATNTPDPCDQLLAAKKHAGTAS